MELITSQQQEQQQLHPHPQKYGEQYQTNKEDDNEGEGDEIYKELLFTTLKNVWQNYLNTSTGDIEAKEHWIHLFLFYYQYVDDFLNVKTLEFQRFFNSIPEEICSFFLQHVYEIICKPESSDSPIDLDIIGSPIYQNDYRGDHQQMVNSIPKLENPERKRRSHNFAQVILNTPADFSKVIALRDFLTDELGHHLLEFLLRVDVKLIASQKGLCNLCINLFPNCSWSNTSVQLVPPKRVLEFVGDFRFHELEKGNKHLSIFKRHARDHTNQNVIKIPPALFKHQHHDHEYQHHQLNQEFQSLEDAYKSFRSARKTSDEIASLLVKLLIKCSSNECETPLSEQSMSVLLLKFALTKMPQPTNPKVDFSLFQGNSIIIKCALLQLIELCLNNIFMDMKNLQIMDFGYVLITLSESFPSISTNFDANDEKLGQLLTDGLIFLTIGIIHNLAVIERRRQQKQQLQILQTNNQQQEQSIFAERFIQLDDLRHDDLISSAEICKKQMLRQLNDQRQHDKEERKALYGCMMNVLSKIVENIQQIESHHFIQPANGLSSNSNPILIEQNANSNESSNTTRPRRRRYFNHQQMHCNIQEQQEHQALCCFFQNLMLDLQSSLPREIQEQNLRHWLRVGICCCHYTLQGIGKFLNWIVDQTPAYQRHTYKFLYRKVLNSIFIRPNIGGQSQSQQQAMQQSQHQPLGKKRSTSSSAALTRSTSTICNLCEGKMLSLDYRLGLLEQYRQLYLQIKEKFTKQIPKPQQQQRRSSLHRAQASDSTVVVIQLLRHFKDIASLLPNDIAVGILAEIVLPIFRCEKTELLSQREEQVRKSKDRENVWKKSPVKTSSSQLISQCINWTQHSLRILFECLNIFIIYLSDIRLIKAFYNEENIQHLEDLLGEPELICGLCDLIKIGIDNLTFLGDNTREQAILSKRLITLQLKSSNRAAQQLSGVLRRLSRHHSAPAIPIVDSMEQQQQQQTIFWLSDINDIDRESQLFTDEWHLNPLDILKITAFQWSLNNDLLRSSQKFYKEFAKAYCIVNEDKDNDNEDNNSTSDNENGNESLNDDQLSKSSTSVSQANKFGNKTILDILKLNYNALSGFLLISPRKSEQSIQSPNNGSPITANLYAETNDSHIYTFTPPQQSPNQTVIDEKNESESFNSLESFLNSLDSTAASSVKWSKESWSSNESNFTYVEANNETFLQRLIATDRNRMNDLSLNESVVLFDIRNSLKSPKENAVSKDLLIEPNSINSKQEANEDLVHSTSTSTKYTLDMVIARPTTAVAAAAAAAIASMQNNESVIGKLFRMFGAILGLTSLPSILDANAQQRKETQQQQQRLSQRLEHQNDIDEDLKGFYQSSSDYKKLLLRIFESTMAISIKGYQNEEAEKMEKHLRKLKAIFLSNAFAHWHQYAEEPTHENTVLQALQVLLLIAELSQANCEPPTTSSVGVDGNGSVAATVTDNDANLTMKSRALSTTTSYKRQISGGGGGIGGTCGGGSNLIATPRRLPSTENVTADFIPANVTSFMCPESDVEISENEQPEHEQNYSNGDEGYEADGEIPELSDSESTAIDLATTDLWNQLQPTSRYRSSVLHSGLCNLIVGITIELAQKCTMNPNGWSDSLAQLVKRLYTIRDSLGGAPFLLESFKPLLECNDIRLRDLQQSILELITDINTPETLCLLFSILSAKSPPVEILIKHMHFICSTTVKKAQPFVELEFPITLDGKCVSTSNPGISERIDRIRNYHLHCQASTPFTRSPCIIPITHARVWNNEGFSLSLWMQAKSGVLTQKSSLQTSQTIEEDAGRSSSIDDGTKTHIVSIGTNELMLSIYLNTNLSLSFEVIKPNGIIPVRPVPATATATQSDEANTSFKDASKLDGNSGMKRNQSGESYAGKDSYGQETSIPSTSTLRNALKQTKMLFNSFSNIIHGPHDGSGVGSNEPYFEAGSAVTLKYHRLALNKWTHLGIAVEWQADHFNVSIHSNGLDQYHLSIPCRYIRHSIRSHAFQMIALGDGTSSLKSLNNSASYHESHSSFEFNSLRLSVSNFMMFNRSINNPESWLNLASLGPDFTELTTCQVANRKPYYGNINLSKMTKANFGNFAECMRGLRDSRLLVYSAQQPDLAMGYNFASSPTDSLSYGRQLGIILYGELLQHHLQSFQTATLLCGGISTLLYLFARVVEASNHGPSQALALDILLTVSLSDSQFYAEFLRNDYFSLIGYVIKAERCSKDIHLLRSIVNNACSQPLIHRKCGESLHVNENTTAILIYPRLLLSVLQRYSDWHRSGAEHSDVLDMLFQCILALTREKHPQRNFNMEQFNKWGLFKALLNLCKVYVIESPNPVYISKYAAQRFVEVVSVFAGAPTTPSLMDELMKLLLLLHKPSECYITHDRSKFYFLLSSCPPPSKDKSIGVTVNFGRVAAPFRRSFGRGEHRAPGQAVPVETSLPTSTANSVDHKRLARINRLKRMNENNLPAYKRPIRSLEEDLESVANCSKLNRKALRLISPVEAANCHSKLRRVISPAKPANWRRKLQGILMPKAPPSVKRKIIAHKRLKAGHHIAVDLEGDSRKHRNERSQNAMTKMQISGASTIESAGIGIDTLDNEDNRSPAQIQQRRQKALAKTDFYRSQGIMALQEGLYNLLKDFLCLLPDNSVDEVLKHYIKVEFLLVLANHSSCAVRASIVRLLAALTKRWSTSEKTNSEKNLYAEHLANQLSMNATDGQVFEACIEWVFDAYGDIMTLLNDDGNIQWRIQQRFGVAALLAVASKLTSQQIEYAEYAFRLLHKAFHRSPDDQQYLITHGLLQCCVKALLNLYSNRNIVLVNAKTENAILDLLTAMGKYSLKSVGHMNVLWDILNMLSFYQENQPAYVIKGFRSVQGQLQLNWIQMFFENSKDAEGTFKVIAFEDSSPPLTLSETKTRLGLIIDRCCQFFTVFDASYIPTERELKLFELLVSYCISSNQRCNNFIAWGLQPSRPCALRAFIVDKLWELCKDDFQPSIICDGKMIKSLLWLCLLEDMEQPLENLESLCAHLGIDERTSVWNLGSELERIELNRCTMSAKQKSMLEKTVYKFESLATGCIESSMATTRRVAELQNAERKLLMCHMKDYDETLTYTRWLEIIRRMTHEGAPWYCKERSENSWELDDTEGPSRVHTRLRRCHLDIDKRFIMPDYEQSSSSAAAANNEQQQQLQQQQHQLQQQSQQFFMTSSGRYSSTSLRSSISEYTRPLEYLITSYDQQLNISLNAQILYNFPAKYLPVDGEIDGEIIITDHKLYFLATYRCKYFYVTCDISSISEIWIKRYQHQEKAFEIFLDTNKSLFFSLQNHDDWKVMRDIFCDKIISQPEQAKILLVTQQWREGFFTNWEYLMALNQIAGRTFNDLMQYPVFPWILSNYSSERLDLTNPQNFRKLEKPIAIQHESNEQHYINNYTYINNTMTNMGSLVLKPYHYSSHYSNSGTVLHFLVRVPPFTSYFLRYQDNNFDLPDRTFHALNTTWNLASHDSPTDVKELIPEFFCLPEMFENFERFNFGCRQNGERVDDVLLPPWCQRDSRLFVLIHRQALECEVVRKCLHQWIDLIFGFKQQGENAVEAINVFHPATYASFIEAEVVDPIERRAVETMVKTYGQMPRQLFKNAHPASKSLNYCLVDKAILPSVSGLRWGIYLGSPQLPTPALGNIHKLPDADYLVCFTNTNVIYGFASKSCVMQGLETDTYNVVSWGHDDRIVRIQALNKPYAKPKNLLNNGAFDEITVCGTDPNSNQLWFGHRSGRITVYKCLSTDNNQRSSKSRQSYVKGLRLSYNSAFRKITSSSTSGTSAAPISPTESQMSNSTLSTLDNLGGNVNTNSALTSSTSLGGGGGGFGADSTQQRDSSDCADLNWIGPTVLIRHTDEITAIALSVEFKIAVSAGRDGIAVIWDLNDWSYIRTIQRPSEIHHSPITLVAISPTLGDIITVHTLPRSDVDETDDINDEQQSKVSPEKQIPKKQNANNTPTMPPADECFEVTEETLDDFVNVSINPNGKSILRLHTVNARYVQHLLSDERITAICYSFIKEGVGVNVIATALEGGAVRLWSSWNLSFVSEILTGTSNIKSMTFSTHQHLVVLNRDAHIQVWETEGLTGSSPKFPQISYK